MHGPRVKSWREPLGADASKRISAVVPKPQPLHLAELLQQARDASGDERQEWADALNALLAAPPAAADRDAWGAALTDLLDEGAFDGFVDTDGVNCRHRAVESLLALGYPWALHVTPADLDRRRRPRLPRWLVTAGVALSGSLIFLWAWSWLQEP